MKVLIGCESSATVLSAFLERGHDTWSCDIKACENPRYANRHIQDDVRNVMKMDCWDLMCVMHPPCTRLCASGVRWLTEPPVNRGPGYPECWDDWSREERLSWMWLDLQRSASLFSDCWNADIPRVAVENPIMHRHAKALIDNFEDEAKHRFTVQPWQFADSDKSVDNEKKRTCFWTRGLPKLEATGPLDGSTARDSVHKASPGENRSTERSRFFPGMAAAMADQWGGYALAEMAEVKTRQP